MACLVAEVAIAVEVLDVQVAEDVAPALEFIVETLEHAQAELALALDGDHTGMRQARAGRRF